MNKTAEAPYILAICNRKGGAGKTTTAVNLAAELAADGLRVLLLDLDTQGHCSVGLGMTAHANQPNIHQLFTDSELELTGLLHTTRYPGLSLVPANPLFEHGSGQRDELRLNRALRHRSLSEQFDAVIIDTPPSFDLLMLNALNAANGVLVPYIPHPLSFDGIRQLMRVLFKVMYASNPTLKLLGFLPTCCAGHIRQHRGITTEVGRQFGAHRVFNGIRNDIRLAESFGAGMPIRHYAPDSRAAHDFREFSELLLPLFR